MILGIGTDLVEIVRFASWQKYTHQQLATLFTQEEIAKYQHYLDIGYIQQACIYLASRYAVKEASYKALCAAYEHLYKAVFPWSFRRTAPMIMVQNLQSGVPIVEFEFKLRDCFQKIEFKKDVSLSHEKTHAIAVVVLSTGL